MPKAYWIAHVNITDQSRYTGYQNLAPDVFAEYGAKFLARGGSSDTLEGYDWQRHVVVEFNSMKDARDCYASEGYKAARKKRSGACTASIIIVEGL